MSEAPVAFLDVNVANQDGAKTDGVAKRLKHPPGVKRSVLWIYAASFITFHLLALLVFVPYFFSWTGVFLLFLGINLFGQLGITICYHRLLTHRSFKVPQWLEHFLVVQALCCAQDTPAKWVAWHRIHHNHSDEEEDPHSPLVNFFWGHIGWLLVHNEGTHDISAYHKYARDILADPFYMMLEKKRWVWTAIYAAHMLLFMVAGFGAGYLMTDNLSGALQFMWSVLVWGVIARTVWVWHITWAVNSMTHLFGYRNYQTGENSQNNWFVAAITGGEGWHNNHHYDQSAATVQHRWWEVDLNYYMIKGWERLGLASNVIPAKHVRHADRGPKLKGPNTAKDNAKETAEQSA